jgi:carboxymethylenebutenolidase
MRRHQTVRPVGRRRLLRRRRGRFADDKPLVPTNCISAKGCGHSADRYRNHQAKRPDVEVHIYPGAQHGFHCDERASYDKASADIAWPRSWRFAKHLKR